MFSRILDKIAGNYNTKQIQALTPLVEQIHTRYNTYESYSDEEIKNLTIQFKQRYSEGTSLDDLLPEAFAAVKQAAKRMCGQSFATK